MFLFNLMINNFW